MASLAKTIADVRDRISLGSKRGLNEENTKATLIEPLLRALGWDTENIDEVVHEYKGKKRDKPVDYGLLITRTPRLFVEAKQLGANLDDRKWANQIMGYAVVAGVEWIVLTDGNEYRIYNTHAPVAVEKKLFRTVKITDRDSPVEQTLRLLAKDKLEENDIKALWRAQFIDSQVRQALESIFTADGDLLVVNYVATRAKDLTTDEIRSSLRRCRATFDFPLFPTEVAPAPALPTKGSATHKAGDASLADLLKAKLLSAPVDLHRVYKGQALKARIEPNGQVRYAGQVYDSPSMAAGTARASIIGLGKDGRPPATNGWTFWQVRRDDGKVVSLADLRAKLPAAGSKQATSSHPNPPLVG